jgi:hypothetical protein
LDPSCPNSFEKRSHGNGGNAPNVVVGNTEIKDVGYGIFPTIISVCHSPEWLIDTDANIHVYANICMLSSYHVVQTSSVLMGNGSCGFVQGVGTVNLKFTLGKNVQLKNVHHVPL